MTDRVLQHVLSDLRPQLALSQVFCIPYSNIDDHGYSILFKLKAETDQLTGGTSNGKKAVVDTHRGGKAILLAFQRKPLSKM